MDILSILKHITLEPKVFALVVSSDKGHLLYIGVHFSLEEAYIEASDEVRKNPEYKGGVIDIDMWGSISTRDIVSKSIDVAKLNPIKQVVVDGIENVPAAVEEIINGLYPPLPAKKEKSVEDYVKEINLCKNSLIKKLIEDKSIAKAENVKTIIGLKSYKYAVSEINKKINSIQGSENNN